jgi:hypothetical protein
MRHASWQGQRPEPVNRLSELPRLLEVQQCSVADAESYIIFLESSDKNLEHGVAGFLRSGQAVLSVAKLPSLAALGALPTFWRWIEEGEKIQRQPRASAASGS